MKPPFSHASTVVLTPRRVGLCVGKDNAVEVVLRIQAPDAPVGHGAQRPPQALLERQVLVESSLSRYKRPSLAACPVSSRWVAVDEGPDCSAIICSVTVSPHHAHLNKTSSGTASAPIHTMAFCS